MLGLNPAFTLLFFIVLDYASTQGKNLVFDSRFGAWNDASGFIIVKEIMGFPINTEKCGILGQSVSLFILFFFSFPSWLTGLALCAGELRRCQNT